jgi:hypothetical protein
MTVGVWDLISAAVGRWVLQRTLVRNRRARVSESGVPTMRVIPAVDEVEHRHARLGLGFEAGAVEQLAF